MIGSGGAALLLPLGMALKIPSLMAMLTLNMVLLVLLVLLELRSEPVATAAPAGLEYGEAAGRAAWADFYQPP
jgi:hypothetical protein